MSNEIENAHDKMVRHLMKNPDTLHNESTPFKWGLLHAVLGIAGELAELVDHEDDENFLEECGDVLFYCRNIRQILDVPAYEFRDPTGVNVIRLIGSLVDHAKRIAIYSYEVTPERLVAILKLVDLTESMVVMELAERSMTREQALEHNIEKLVAGPKARYKNGYSDDAAAARADKQPEEQQPSVD